MRAERLVAPTAVRGDARPPVPSASLSANTDEVHAGAEVPAFGGEHERPDLPGRGELVDDHGQVAPERRDHRVAPLGADHAQVRHPVGGLEVEALVGHAGSSTRSWCAPMSATAITAGTSPGLDQRWRVPFCTYVSPGCSTTFAPSSSSRVDRAGDHDAVVDRRGGVHARGRRAPGARPCPAASARTRRGRRRCRDRRARRRRRRAGW